jgi:hypothetical protein
MGEVLTKLGDVKCVQDKYSLYAEAVGHYDEALAIAITLSDRCWQDQLKAHRLKSSLFFFSPKLFLMVQLLRECLQKQIRTCHLKLADAQNIEKVVEIRKEEARCMRRELVTLNLARRQDKSEKKLKGLQDENVSRRADPGFVHLKKNSLTSIQRFDK